MVNKDVEGPYRRVLAAVDMSDASVHAVQSAKTLGFFDNAQISIAHAFQPLAKSTLVMVGAAQDGIDAHVAHEHLRASQELDAFLKSHGIGDPAWSGQILARFRLGPRVIIGPNVWARLQPDAPWCLRKAPHRRKPVSRLDVSGVAGRRSP
jgi:hypothetical protein